ncbi:MAG: hypothetical protein NC092_04560 [Butyrivibrio sp.]|nr:hypothetical protein [Muribaculum sp.]MCM1551946.1 hypothetical protein [Butyrivibrio sp.]
MLVYKATDEDMTCHMGKGRFQYQLGVPAFAEASKCANTGLHACEYVIDCLRYYPLFGNGRHRYFKAEASGDIAEDGHDTRIACTRLTLVQELDNAGIAREAMRFMINHPKRGGWKYRGAGVMIEEGYACGNWAGGIAIARGDNPSVRGGEGTHVGLLREVDGKIVEAKLCKVTKQGPIKPGVEYTLEGFAKAFMEWSVETRAGNLHMDAPRRVMLGCALVNIAGRLDGREGGEG